jgi:hypothetical protein
MCKSYKGVQAKLMCLIKEFTFDCNPTQRRESEIPSWMPAACCLELCLNWRVEIQPSWTAGVESAD